jgi:hypothetical protein
MSAKLARLYVTVPLTSVEQPCTAACGCEVWIDTSDDGGACGNPLTKLVHDQEVSDNDEESD